MLIQITSVILVVAGAFAVSPSFAADDVNDSPVHVVNRWAGAFNTNDATQILPFYDQSEQTEVIMSAGTRHLGYKAIKKAYVSDLKNVKFYDSKTINATSRIIGDTALISFEHRFKIHFTKDGTRWQVHIRSTTVLNRIHGKWKIALEHSSPIQGTERYTKIQPRKPDIDTRGDHGEMEP